MTVAPTTFTNRPPAATEPPWNRLDQPALGPASTPVLAALYAALSFGLVPAFVRPVRWAALLDDERSFYTDLVDGWRRRVAPGDAKQLDGVLAGLRPRPMLIVLPWLAATFAAVPMVLQLVTGDVPRLVHLTYGFHQRTHPDAYPNLGSLGYHLHAAWVYGLSFAYACHWYAVRSHGRTVGDLVRWTNTAARHNGLKRVPTRPGRWVQQPLWVIAGVLFCGLHAWWAVPMVLAGAIQRRYADATAPGWRAGLSEQARGVAAIASESTPMRYCPGPHCGEQLAAAARFCPRCGGATVAAAAEG